MKTKVYTYMIISNEAGNDHLSVHTSTSLSKNLIEEWHSEDTKNIQDRNSFIVKVFPIEEREVEIPDGVPQSKERVIHTFLYVWNDGSDKTYQWSSTNLEDVAKTHKKWSRLLGTKVAWIGKIQTIADVERQP
jgi:hypothetical protein